MRRASRSRGPNRSAAAPLDALLGYVKESLRDPKTAAPNAAKALETCDLVLSAAGDCLPADYPERSTLTATAHSRRGDALLLLGRPEDALAAFNAAAALTPDNAYVIYNRGCALLALDRKDEAKADFTTASGAKYKRTGARKLALEALAGMK